MSTSKANPLRSIARRAWRATSIRADVRVEQLARQVTILEKLMAISDRIIDIQPGILAALAPSQCEELVLERIGSEFDGGYVLPKQLIESASGVVSIGIGDNNDADFDLAVRGLDVHAWDHTVRGLPRNHGSITFHQIGVGANDSRTLRTLQSITDESFGNQASNLILLMDAEGAEWSVLSTISDQTLGRYDVLCLELHGLGDSLLPGSRIVSILARLRELFVPVSVHANNYGAFWQTKDFVLPDIIEVTYVRKGLISSNPVIGNSSSSLLTPCCPDLPEVQLNWCGDNSAPT